MLRPQVRDGSDPQVIRDTRVLVDCLQEFVRGAVSKTIRDCSRYPELLWLEDVPDGNKVVSRDGDLRILQVRHHPPQDAPRLPKVLRGRVSTAAAAVAGPHPPPLEGVVRESHLLEASPVGTVGALELEPGEAGDATVRQAYEAWVSQWRAWAEKEMAAEPQRRLHGQLHRIAKRLEQDGDAVEAVLAYGLVQLGSERASARVRRHVVTTPVTVKVDKASITMTVSLVPERPGRLEDADFLSESDGYTSELLDVVRDVVEDAPLHPMSDEAVGAVRSWAQRALGTERAVTFDAAGHPADLTGEPHVRSVHHAPALILREHDRRSVLGFYESIARALKNPDVQAPLGLAQLLYDLEPEQRTAWRSGTGTVPPALGPDPLFPLVTNSAQRHVLERLQRDTSVVVQGPPGTGKTHTISNLLAALLADGKRVLVTSEKGHALKVLRDQLPPRLRSMCVIQTDQWQGGRSDLRRSLEALEHLNATTDLATLRQRIEDEQVERHRLMGEQAGLRDRLRQIREIEWYEYKEIAPGYQGRLDDIVKAVDSGAAAYSWLPPLPDQAAEEPPLTPDDADQLWGLISQHGPTILDAHMQHCPDPSSLPSPGEVSHRIASLHAAEQTVSAEAVTPLARALAERGDSGIAALEDLLEGAQQALQKVGLSADPDTWQDGDWVTCALKDGIAQRRQQLWDSIRNASKRARLTHDAIAEAGFLNVDIPDIDESQENEQLTAARNLERYLRTADMPSRRWPRPAVVRQGKFLLEKCRVEGMAATTRDQIATIIRDLEMRGHLRTLRSRWKGVGSSVEQEDREPMVSELLDRATVLDAVDTCVDAVREVHRTMLAYGIRLPVTTGDQLQQVYRGTVQARQLLRIEAAVRYFEEIRQQVPNHQPHGVEELQWAADALSARDAQGYGKAMEALAAAYQREADRRAASSYWKRLTEAHEELGGEILADPHAPHWQARLADMPRAWAWRRARHFLDTHLMPGLEERLEGELADLDNRLQNLVRDLVSDRAAHHCISRMSTRQKQALAAYASAIANAGQATTTLGKRHQRNARSAMLAAQGAVPAWIMPLRQVAEMIAPEPDSFDVVIVDEASQVGLEGLLLLWLAPRIIVVGDDRQCAPFYTGSRHDRIHQVFDERLAALEPWQREGFDPKSNLYELLKSRFTEVVRLTEHFRSMPEIIKWSSMQFYPDNQLVFLRQHGTDRLPPLKTVHVPEGHCEGRRDKLINRPEAEAMVEQLHRLTQDPAYAQRSMGVIILRHGAQTRLVQDLVDQRLDVAVRERHHILIGTPEQFQGDERDVVLLSMVVDGANVIAATGRGHERRFNVAASRARDQMWIFHSMTLDQLGSKDLRRSLLSYMQNPPPPYTYAHRPVEVPTDRSCAPFESLFEQRVYRRIHARGYDVVPQWEVNGKRIDLVVTGGHGRLAVECDGSPYHSKPQDIQADAERERELRRAGWTFWRVRSSAFALSPEQALEPLWTRLAELGIHPRPAQTSNDGVPATSWAPVSLAEEEQGEEDLDPYDGEPDDNSEEG
ncbi:AAA domain-containing protein [Streptomyces sp. NPDC054901]